MATMRDLPRRVSTRVQEALTAEEAPERDQCGGCGTRYLVTADTFTGCCPACAPYTLHEENHGPY